MTPYICLDLFGYNHDHGNQLTSKTQLYTIITYEINYNNNDW